jgi:hypothetical protein
MSFVVGVAVLTLGVLLPGEAATASPATTLRAEVVTVSTPMVFGGYDVAVATAHGYKIVTEADGTQHSVAVTDAAKTAQTLRPNNTVPGECGKSFVNAAKLPGDTVAYQTGYQVPFAVYERDWHVDIVGITGMSDHPDFGGQTSGAWSTEGTSWIIGPGVAAVPLWAFVMAFDGQICHSNGPSASFG